MSYDSDQYGFAETPIWGISAPDFAVGMGTGVYTRRNRPSRAALTLTRFGRRRRHLDLRSYVCISMPRDTDSHDRHKTSRGRTTVVPRPPHTAALRVPGERRAPAPNSANGGHGKALSRGRVAWAGDHKARKVQYDTATNRVRTYMVGG